MVVEHAAFLDPDKTFVIRTVVSDVFLAAEEFGCDRGLNKVIIRTVLD